MAVEMSPHQFSTCQEANGQFCNVVTPFQPPMNLPSCITALYTKNACSTLTRCSLQIRKTQDVSIPSQLTPGVWILTTPPSATTTAITLISPGDIKIYYNTETNSDFTTTPSLQCYNTQLPSTPTLWKLSFRSQHVFGYGKSKHDQHVISWFAYMATFGKASEWESATTLGQHTLSSSEQLYRHMAKGIHHITPFTSPEESTGDTDSIWTLFSHTGVYVMAIGLFIPAGLGIFCCYFFWCQPARLAGWPLQPGTMQYSIVDDDVEAVSIYRCNCKVSQPTRPCGNHGLCIEHIPTWMESWCKQQMQSLLVPAQGSLVNTSKIQGTQKCT